MNRRQFVKLALLAASTATATHYGLANYGSISKVVSSSARYFEEEADENLVLTIDASKRVPSLLRRAGFAGTPEESSFYEKLGFEGTVERLINYEKIDNSHLPSQPNITMSYEKPRGREEFRELVWWWADRLVRTNRPLEERMTLFWHNHFATSIHKVKSPYLMYRQNQLLRQTALGNFRDLLVSMTKDPAMLIWLDGARNRKGNPNENYAREVMEVFTTGRGHYTEKDIKEAARAFTGYTLDKEGNTTFVTRLHDNGTKTFLGETGNLDAEDIVDILAKHPATARNLSRQLFEYFAYDSPGEEIVEHLSRLYLSSGYSIKTVVEEILKSEELFSRKAYLNHVKSPVEYVVIALRSLEAMMDPNAAIVSMSRMGQVLFDPPSVFGWPLGMAWIDTSSLLERWNFPLLVQTSLENKQSKLDPREMFGKDITEKEAVNKLTQALFPDGLEEEVTQVIQRSTESIKEPARKLKNVVRLVMATPFYNLN